MIDASQKKILTGMVVGALLFGAFFLWDYFTLIIAAIIVAFLFNPIYKRLERKFKRNGTASALTIVIAFLTLLIPLVAILILTVEQAISIVEDIRTTAASSDSIQATISTLVNQTNNNLSRLPIDNQVSISSESITSFLKENITNIANSLVTVIKNSVGGIASFFTLLIIFLFVLSSLFRFQDSIIATFRRLNPLGDEIFDLYLDKASAMTAAMVRGQFIIALAQGFAGAGFLWLLGYDYFFFMAILFSLLSIIPLGAGIIVIPFGIILILTGNVVDGVLVLAFHFLVVTNIDNVLRPRLVPKHARLNPALTILSVFAGIGMFGFIGIVIGPVIMILIVTTIRIYLDLQETKKQIKVSAHLKKS